MPTLAVYLSDEQLAAVRKASDMMMINDSQFVSRALALLCSNAGVEFPASLPVKPPPTKHNPRPRGGRPPALPTWEMSNHIPAGTFPRVCPRCGRSFRADEPRTVYCSERCQISAQQARIYRRRAERKKGEQLR